MKGKVLSQETGFLTGNQYCSCFRAAASTVKWNDDGETAVWGLHSSSYHASRMSLCISKPLSHIIQSGRSPQSLLQADGRPSPQPLLFFRSVWSRLCIHAVPTFMHHRIANKTQSDGGELLVWWNLIDLNWKCIEALSHSHYMLHYTGIQPNSRMCSIYIYIFLKHLWFQLVALKWLHVCGCFRSFRRWGVSERADGAAVWASRRSDARQTQQGRSHGWVLHPRFSSEPLVHESFMYMQIYLFNHNIETRFKQKKTIKQKVLER